MNFSEIDYFNYCLWQHYHRNNGQKPKLDLEIITLAAAIKKKYSDCELDQRCIKNKMNARWLLRAHYVWCPQ